MNIEISSSQSSQSSSLKSLDRIVYVLRLDNNKYYVGVTKESLMNEDDKTIEMIIKHGIENVRGGKYCKMKLDDLDMQMIHRDTCQKTNTCFHCGLQGHFISQCPNKNKKEKEKTSIKRIIKKKCAFCGRLNHTSNNCFAQTDIYGVPVGSNEYSSEEYEYIETVVSPKKKKTKEKRKKIQCQRCGRTTHDVNSCYAKVDVDGDPIMDESSSEEEAQCQRCGRDNHTANECYAKRDIYNKRIYN